MGTDYDWFMIGLGRLELLEYTIGMTEWVWMFYDAILKYKLNPMLLFTTEHINTKEIAM